MPSDHPHTPQSPSQNPYEAIDLPPKPATSPRINTSLPTPAHSINDSMSSTEITSAGASQGEELSHKRKRSFGDQGDQGQKKVHVEDSRLSIEDLHLDVGPKYLLCRTPHRMAQPQLSQDLFELYGLTGIAASVAREGPNGQKNIVRKTYKGYIKNAGLSGLFDSVKKELDDPDTLYSMMIQPQEEWDAQCRGTEIEKGMPEMTAAQLGEAMTMAKGVIPKDVWNLSVLGELGATVPAVDATKSIVAAARIPIPTAPSTHHRPGKAEIPRPKRNVKKRTYGDSSYEGYGEGFVDDELQETGYSTGDGDDRNGARKRPKKSGPAHSLQGAIRQNSYGPGMVGA